MTYLQQGAIAPSFTKPDYLGQKVTVPNSANRPVFLSFYRYATCPMCNLRTREIILAHERFAAANIEVIAVWQSPKEKIIQQMEKQKPPFPVIADPEMELYELYKVQKSWTGLAKMSTRVGALSKAMRLGFTPGAIDGPINRIPADILIGADGRVIDAYYGKDAGDHMPLDQLFAHF